MDAVRRTEDHDARRPDGGRNVCDSGIVPDENVGSACKRGQFRQAEVGERRDLAFCGTLHRLERRGLVRCGNGRHTKATRGEVFGGTGEILRGPLLRLVCRGRMKKSDPFGGIKPAGDRGFGRVIRGQRRRFAAVDLDARKPDQRKLLLDGMQLGRAPKIGGRTVKMRVCPRETIMRKTEAIFGKRRGRKRRAGRAAMQVDDRVVTPLFEPRGGP